MEGRRYSLRKLLEVEGIYLKKMVTEELYSEEDEDLMVAEEAEDLKKTWESLRRVKKTLESLKRMKKT